MGLSGKILYRQLYNAARNLLKELKEGRCEGSAQSHGKIAKEKEGCPGPRRGGYREKIRIRAQIPKRNR